MNDIDRQVLGLYREMPGAPPIPREDGREVWGDVVGNAHWNFCLQVVRTILAAVGGRA